MSLDEVKKGFLTSYYLWSKDQLQKEFESDFPFLNTISSCKPVIDFFRSLSDREQLVAISIFSKRGHTDVVGPLEVVATSEETGLLQNYKNHMGLAIARANIDDFRNRGRSFDRVAFTRNVEAEVGSVLGNVIEKGGQFYRRYSRDFGTFRIETTIHTGGRSPHLQYEHRLLTQEGVIHEHISILSWLGIIWGPTNWRRVNDDNSKTVVEACKKAFSTFVNAAPKLVGQTD